MISASRMQAQVQARRLSIIMPVLNEAEKVEHTLSLLSPLRERGIEVIVVDGGSFDDTLRLAAPLSDRLLQAPAGRARQMNAGAVASSGEVLLFLHADTLLPDGMPEIVLDGLSRTGKVWGRFDIRIAGKPQMLRLVAALMNMRSRLTGIMTGDQALFVRRNDFFEVGGFPGQELMEDIEISRRLKRRSAPLCLRGPVITSGRRWERNGVWRTILLMGRLRLLYWLGVPCKKLARAYK